MTGELVIVGDVHLDRDDADLAAFLAFLDRLVGRAARLVLVGDLFNLWLGDREVELPHQSRVIARLEGLRREGIVVHYVEGNRDFHLRRAYVGTALDDAADGAIAETWGGLRLFVAHGDLVNRADRRYRAWRRVARSAPLWLAFRTLSARRRLRLAEWMERRLRPTNVEHKSGFPEREVRRYAATHLAAGFDAVVLGHFHAERDLRAEPPSRPGRILVLPCWKDRRRHLSVGPGGQLAFAESE